MVHNFNQFLIHRSLLESQILERAEGDFFPEENIEISPTDIKEPTGPPDQSPSSSTSIPASNQILPNNVTINPKGLKLGSGGIKNPNEVPDVKKLQQILIDQGFLRTKSGIPTGYFGELTASALERYQKSGGSPAQQNQNQNRTTPTSPPKHKKVFISDQTNQAFLKKLSSQIARIDSSASNNIFNINMKVGCATFVNQFTNAVNAVGDAWLSRDVINGKVIYDVFNPLTPKQRNFCVNLWNKIYNRKSVQKWQKSGEESDNIKKFITSLIAGKRLDPSILKVGDICGIYYPPSSHHEEAFFLGGKNYFTDEKGNMGKGNVPGKTITSGTGWTFNTHLGIVGAIEKGKPVIFHATPRNNNSTFVWADGIPNLIDGGKIVWVERPLTAQSPKQL